MTKKSEFKVGEGWEICTSSAFPAKNISLPKFMKFFYFDEKLPSSRLGYKGLVSVSTLKA